MYKLKYEVTFDSPSKSFILCGGDSKQDLWNLIAIYGSTPVEKQRAYEHLAKMREKEKIRRRDQYQSEVELH